MNPFNRRLHSSVSSKKAKNLTTFFIGCLARPLNASALWRKYANNTTTGNMVLDSNFKEFIQSLNANGVKYLVIGGFAVAYHGYPRYTKDIDFWIWASPDNATRVLQTIRDFGFGSLGLTEDDFLDTTNVIQIGQAPNRIDLIMELEGMDFAECYEHRREVTFEGISLPNISSPPAPHFARPSLPR